MTAKKKMKAQRAPAEEAVKATPRKTVTVKLTLGELVHLRDLFGVLLPPAATKTLSQALAERTGRPMVEACLWRKLNRSCVTAGLPVGEDAPDFAVSIGSVPELAVFQVESDGDEGEQAGTGELARALEDAGGA